MAVEIKPIAGRAITTPTPAFELSTTLEQRVVSSSSASEVTVDDLVFDRTVGAQYYNDGRVDVSGIIAPGINNPFVRYTSENAAVTVATDGSFTSNSVSDMASILVATPFATKRITFPSGAASSTVDVYDRYVNGSFGKALFDGMTAPLADYATGSSVFSSRNDTTATYVRASNFAGIDLSGWSAWSSSHGVSRAAVAITERHVLLSAHYAPSIGATIRFVTLDNQVVERTLTARTTIGIGVDMQVGTLSSDLPESIKVYKVLPADWEDHITSLRSMPLLFTKNNLIYPRTWTNSNSMVDRVFYYPAVWSVRSTEWSTITQNIVVGDSSKPVFGIIGDEPVFMGMNWQAWLDVNGLNVIPGGIVVAMINAVTTPYTMSTVDLSSFPTYGS